MLDPAEAAGGVPANTGGVPGAGVIAPAKIDPSLPGVFHPAHRGTPGLDTIDETVAPGAVAQQAGSGGAPQNATALAGASQGQVSGSATAADGQGGGGGSGGSSVTPGETDGDGGEPSRRPSYAAALMSDPVGGSEVSVGVGNGTGLEAGSSEQGGEAMNGDGAATLPEASGATKGAPAPAAEEVQQSGGRKIPGNPPYESDEDDDEQENDISHPEGFLRAMPEDESSMRVLELPDGRVQRREEEDEEEEEKAAGVAAAAAATAAAATAAATAAAATVASGDSPAESADTAAPSLTAPSSAQAPPLSSGAPAPTAAEVAVVAVASPAVQAPRPPTADPAVFYSAGGRHRPSASVGGAISPETMFPTIGGGNDPAARSDPGVLASIPVGPAVGLQRARSFSPLEHAPEAPLHSAASMPPMVPPTTNSAPVTPLTSPPMTPASTVPAPSFPAPRPPGGNVQFVEKQPPRAEGVQPPDVLGTGNGPGPALQPSSLPVGAGEGEKPPMSAQQSDQELQGMLSGRTAGSAARLQTEIKIANLQGPEQEIMRLVMHTHIEGRLQEVEFDFNLDHDHPEQVRFRDSSSSRSRVV